MRQIVLDIETTGLDVALGNRVIEIGCIELIDRRPSGNNYHQYINPQREMEPGALAIHGITSESLLGEPVFSSIAGEFVDYISGAELIIHNAPFDVGFLDHELSLDKRFGAIKDHCRVVDTLVMAKSMYPGQQNSLDALARRYGVNIQRVLHGALVDSEILAEVYLLMTGGQTGLELEAAETGLSSNHARESIQHSGESFSLPVIQAVAAEIELHQAFLELINKKSGGKCLWSPKLPQS